MIEWKGNLLDDCWAEYKEYHLHAENMDRNDWWWGVFSGTDIIASSNDTDIRFKKGKIARTAAETALLAHIEKLDKDINR